MAASSFTEEMRELARRHGADLVGFAPVERWANAPIQHSPLGLFPGAKTAMVCGVHFLDATTELGAEEDPRAPGPALTEMSASVCLQSLAFRLARALQDRGHRAMFIRQSGAWAYRPTVGAERGWIADMCHYYAAVCAGLGEIGWNNLCLTPEYGPRQRFVTVLTDAELEPTPMYDGPPLCDRCLLCARNCPTRCFDVDRPDRMLSIEVEGKRYEFPDRNLWRCAVGENFMLDVFLPEWENVHIDEALMTAMEERAVREHPEWVTGWKMGMCLKHCMTPQRRYFDRQYCKAPRRKRDVVPDTRPDAIRAMLDEVTTRARQWDIDLLGMAPTSSFLEHGIDLTTYLPGAMGAMVLGLGYPAQCALNTGALGITAELQLAKVMQDGYGFSTLTRAGLSADIAAIVCGLAEAREDGTACSARFGANQAWRVIITDAPLPLFQTDLIVPAEPIRDPAALTAHVKEIARLAGADLVGVSSAGRLVATAEALRPICAKEDGYFVVQDQGWPIHGENIWCGQGQPFNPVATAVTLAPRVSADYLPGAQSVLVIGLRMLDASVDEAGMPPAYKAGHYHTSVHEECFELLSSVLRAMAKALEAQGYCAVPTFDFEGLASRVYGGSADLTASRFAALAAGLGDLGWNGLVLTPEFGARQRFAALVTDAPLTEDPVYVGPALCRQCRACVSGCVVDAIAEQAEHTVVIGERAFSWGQLDRLRCDCAKRYALVGESRPAYVGSTNDVALPETITPEFVIAAVRDSDRMQRPGYCPTVERCLTACPAHLRQLSVEGARSEAAQR